MFGDRKIRMRLLIVRILYRLKGYFENPIGLFRELGVMSSDRILEIGCAIGYHTLPLAKIASNGRIYAVDIWDEGLALLRHRTSSIENIEIICQSGEAVDLAPSSFDKVVCFDTLHDIPESETAIVKWMGLLKKQGMLFYRDPMIPPERIPSLSSGKLRLVKNIKGISVFVRE
jgi:ubiquinone/menaquinone biosynthesis C-methylase UbiE